MEYACGHKNSMGNGGAANKDSIKTPADTLDMAQERRVVRMTQRHAAQFDLLPVRSHNIGRHKLRGTV